MQMEDASDTVRVEQARSRITEVTPREALDMRRRGDDVVYLDVREKAEWNLFRIPDAVHIPLGSVTERVKDAVPRDRCVLVYCARGNRSVLAAEALQEMGYVNVLSLSGGIRAWAEAGGELEE